MTSSKVNEIDRTCFELETYIQSVVNGISKNFPSQASELVGFTKEAISNMICSCEEYDLIENNVYNLWDKDISIENAVEILSAPLRTYFCATTDVL